jgi:hypothetical protein
VAFLFDQARLDHRRPPYFQLARLLWTFGVIAVQQHPSNARQVLTPLRTSAVHRSGRDKVDLRSVAAWVGCERDDTGDHWEL